MLEQNFINQLIYNLRRKSLERRTSAAWFLLNEPIPSTSSTDGGSWSKNTELYTHTWLFRCANTNWRSFHLCEARRRNWDKKCLPVKGFGVGMVQKSSAHGCKLYQSKLGGSVGKRKRVSERERERKRFGGNFNKERWTNMKWLMRLGARNGPKTNLVEVRIWDTKRRKIWGSRRRAWTSRLKWLHVRFQICENGRCWSDRIWSTVDIYQLLASHCEHRRR